MIKKEDRILDIVSDYPETENLFKPYDEVIGKCVMCHHLFETLEEFTNIYNLDLKDLLDNLNRKT